MQTTTVHACIHTHGGVPSTKDTVLVYSSNSNLKHVYTCIRRIASMTYSIKDIFRVLSPLQGSTENVRVYRYTHDGRAG